MVSPGLGWVGCKGRWRERWPVYEMLPRARSWGLGQGSKWATDNSLVAGEGTQPQEMALFSRILALAGWVKMKQTW